MTKPDIKLNNLILGHGYSVALNTMQPALTLQAEPIIFPGFVHGFRQSMGVLRLRLQTQPMQALHAALAYYFDVPISPPPDIQSPHDLINCFAECLFLIQKQGGMPIFEKHHVLFVAENPRECILWVPTLFAPSLHVVIAFVLKLFNHYLTPAPFVANQALAAQLKHVIATLKTHAPQGSNSLHFLKAAHEAELPWAHVMHNVFQYGYGHYAKWLDSTFTDTTSHLAVRLAQNKHATSMLLRQAGFPVAEQRIVNDETEAVALAKQLGFPVVIKPLSQDGGKGVSVNLNSALAVKQAYAKAKPYSAATLLEKHIAGKDYRLLVLQGQLIWAIERIPAGVMGDGQHSVETLIQQHNQHHVSHYPLRHIQVSEDVETILIEQGYTLASIPQAHQWVALQAIANISMGGTPVAVFDKVHPDNRRLAEAVATLFRFDLVGIDFITENIEESYLEKGGAIIEINAQPQIGSTTGPHLYRQILTTLVPKQGRIPILVIYGQTAADDVAKAQELRLLQQYYKVGKVARNRLWVNGTTRVNTTSLYEAGRSALLQPDIEALIYCIENDSEIEQHGLPFDRFDQLFLLDTPPQPKSPWQQDVCQTLQRACLTPCH